MKSIKSKLIVSFSILIILSSMIIGLISLEIGIKEIKKEAENSVQLLATDGAKLTESRMDTLIQTLDMIAIRKDVREMGWDAESRVKEVDLENKGFKEIGM